MQSTYDLAMPRVLAHEGGFVNHPSDPGGATNKGVTQAVYDRFRQGRGEPTRSVRRITASEIAAIYRGGYWDPIKGDLLPAGPDYATFDAAVNSGVSRGSRWLQRAVGARQDGRVGVRDTVPRANAAGDKAAVVRRICAYRLSFMQGLKIWKTFGRGWARRVAEVEVFAVSLALRAAGASGVAVAAAAKAEAERAERAKGEARKGAAVAGAGGAASGGAGVVDAPADLYVVPGWVFAALAAVLIIVAAILLWRAHVQKARAAAYRDTGEERAMLKQHVIAEAVLGSVESAVVAAVADRSVPLDAPAGKAREAAQAVKQRVARNVAADPVVRHLTNTEPWYQSRVTIGALISMLAMALAAAGVTIAAEERELLVAIALGVGGLVGPLTTLYGRWMARRPIGA